LLLELFPLVAKNFLTTTKKKAFEAVQADKAAKEAAKAEKQAQNDAEARAALDAQKIKPITGKVVEAPLPGRVVDICVKVGDKVKVGDSVIILEAMKMENTISTDYAGTVKQIIVSLGDAVAAHSLLIEIE
jgi:biotin carboxyl carrier protein